ncbi:MAG: type IIL restriction-modification enzyme MmeI [Halobacteriota archaeon]
MTPAHDPSPISNASDTPQIVHNIRERYPNTSLADLYDPLIVPKDLLDAHKRLDTALDRCYRRGTFKTESERLHFLFGRYAALTTSAV